MLQKCDFNLKLLNQTELISYGETWHFFFLNSIFLENLQHSLSFSLWNSVWLRWSRIIVHDVVDESSGFLEWHWLFFSWNNFISISRNSFIYSIANQWNTCYSYVAYVTYRSEFEKFRMPEILSSFYFLEFL